MRLENLYYSVIGIDGPSGFLELLAFVYIGVHLRDTMRGDGRAFTKDHPFSSWVSLLLLSFAGRIQTNHALGMSPIEPLYSPLSIIIVTVIWFCIFFTPGDHFYKLCKSRYVYLCLASAYEFFRNEKIFIGVSKGWTTFPYSLLLMVLLGTISGNATEFIAPLTRTLRGEHSEEAPDAMALSKTTRNCILVSIIYSLALIVRMDKIHLYYLQMTLGTAMLCQKVFELEDWQSIGVETDED